MKWFDRCRWFGCQWVDWPTGSAQIRVEKCSRCNAERPKHA